MKQRLYNYLRSLVIILAGIFLVGGCATSKINWDSRVGNYTFDQAVAEFGPPDRSAKLSDGKTVSEWLLFRGGSGGYAHFSPGLGGYWFQDGPQMPDRFLRLSFSPEGRLESWKKISK